MLPKLDLGQAFLIIFQHFEFFGYRDTIGNDFLLVKNKSKFIKHTLQNSVFCFKWFYDH